MNIETAIAIDAGQISEMERHIRPFIRRTPTVEAEVRSRLAPR